MIPCHGVFPRIAGDREATMEDRVRVHEEFERGVTRVLICTDLSEDAAQRVGAVGCCPETSPLSLRAL